MKRPLSMTAFGRGEANGDRSFVVELRSVNHRHLDVKIKMPRDYAALEERVKKELGATFSRGHIEATITQGQAVSARRAKVNLELAAQYLRCLTELQTTFELEGKPSLALLAALPDVLGDEESSADLEAVWQGLLPALRQAIAASLTMRAEEGQALKHDLLTRLAAFETTVTAIAGRIPDLVARREATLRERLGVLLQGVELDPLRLAQEVAVMADRYDVTEELVRLNSHIQQFRRLMEIDEPSGRRLDFLLQEFLREINTLASKINDTAVTHQTVELKNEVEKIREQVQNLE